MAAKKHLKRFYINAGRARNKQDKLEALAQSQIFDMTCLSETCWVSPVIRAPCWIVMVYLFWRDTQDRIWAGMALCVMEGIECVELTSAIGTVESLWVKLKGQTNNVDVTVVVYYSSPIQDDDVKKLFFEESRDTSKSMALVLMRDFSLSEINWEHHTAGTSWARRFLKNLSLMQCNVSESFGGSVSVAF